MQPEIAISELLDHADFVRRLALHLLGDEQRAADAAQETWLAALEHPPLRRPNLKGWLAAIVRNAAFRGLQKNARREERERAAARPEAVPSTAALVERAEARQRVVAAVLALDEPYRSAILYRFYEGLAPREIAAALGVPLETVRSRLKRALALLRGRLAADFGSRTAWCLALAPLAGLTIAAPPAAAAAGATAAAPWLASAKSMLSGGLLMTTKVKAAIAAAAVLAAAFVVWQVGTDSEDRAGAEPAGQPPVAASPAVGAGRARGPAAEEEAPAVEQEAPAALREALEPAGVAVAGRVVDMVTGEPVPFYRLDLRPLAPRPSGVFTGLPREIGEAVADRDGRFNFRLAYGGPCSLSITSPTHLEKRAEIELPPEGLAGLELRLDPGAVISGRVVDAETAEPVAGAIVGSRVQPHLENVLIRGTPWGMPHAISDAEGRFRLSGMMRGANGIAAAHPDFAEGNVRIDTRSPPEEVEIRMPRGFRIYGTVLDDAGEPAAGIVVSIYGPNIQMPYPVLTQADGSYRSPPAAPGKVTVTAEPVAAAGPEGPVFTAETRYTEVVDADVRVDFGPFEDLITWRGTLYDYDGSPIPGAEVVLDPEPYYRDHSPADRRLLSAATDAEGRFSFGKMNPWNYSVRIELQDPRSHIDWGQITLSGKGLFRQDLQIAGSVISGVIIDGVTGKPLAGQGGVALDGFNEDASRRWYRADSGSDARFLIRGIPPGEYTISAHAPGRPSTPPTALSVGLNEVFQDFRLVIPAGGLLAIKVLNTGNTLGRTFELALVQGEPPESGQDCRFAASGVFEQEYALAAGRWRAVLMFDGLGLVEKPFFITPGKTTEILVDCASLEFFEGTVTVAGEVVLPDGSPAVGARVVFRPFWVAAEAQRPHLEAMTDGEGRFELGGFHPGSYAAYIHLTPSACVMVGLIDIPAQPSDPFPCRLAIARGGTVRGRVVEAGTGLDLDPQQHPVIAHVERVQGGRGSASDALSADGRFEVNNVPAGVCRLRIHHLEQHEDYESRPFRVTAGQTVDLGAVEVLRRAPAGSIRVEVVDAGGQPVHYVDVEITNNAGFERKVRRAALPNDFDRLPLGFVRLKLSKEGYRPYEQVLDLLPDKPAQLRAVLEKE